MQHLKDKVLNRPTTARCSGGCVVRGRIRGMSRFSIFCSTVMSVTGADSSRPLPRESWDIPLLLNKSVPFSPFSVRQSMKNMDVPNFLRASQNNERTE